VEEVSGRSVVQSLPYGVKKVYAVRRGYRTWIYFQWPECEVQVKGFPGAVFKGFKSIKETEDWLAVGRVR
jgi:viroplasmin and RNaseH domain-containing protein